MDRSFLRQRARDNLSGSWGLSVGVALIACMLGGLLVGSQFLPELSSQWDWDALRNLELERLSLRVGSFLNIDLLGFILGGAVQLGYAQFLLKQHDRQDPEFRDLFSQFHRFGQGFAQHFLRGLYTALWSLLFIIPGIIAHYRYAMTPYIMAEHPDMTAGEAIEASKQMMDGHKGELFLLHLSFIGWDILAALTLNLGHILLNPYKNAAEAAFYRDLAANKRYEQYEF